MFGRSFLMTISPGALLRLCILRMHAFAPLFVLLAFTVRHALKTLLSYTALCGAFPGTVRLAVNEAFDIALNFHFGGFFVGGFAAAAEECPQGAE